jgi:hypothetical protein
MYSLGLFRGVDARMVHGLGGQIIREEGFSYKPALFENAPHQTHAYEHIEGGQRAPY